MPGPGYGRLQLSYARYELDGSHFPGRVMAGTETFPFEAYDYWKETERLPYVIGDFVWTSIDYLGESGIGKVSIDDATPFFAAQSLALSPGQLRRYRYLRFQAPAVLLPRYLCGASDGPIYRRA